MSKMIESDVGKEGSSFSLLGDTDETNYVYLCGIVGDRIRTSTVRGKPSSFSVKTVREIVTLDGDSLNKFDWHTVLCMSSRLVTRLEADMRVQIEGAISTTRSRSAIIATKVRVIDLDETWSLS